MKTAAVERKEQSTGFLGVMDALVGMDELFREAIACYSLFKLDVFEERMSIALDAICENASRCLERHREIADENNWLNDRISSLIDEGENLSLLFYSGSSNHYAELSRRLIIARTHVQYMLWEHGCFECVDAVRRAHQTYSTIGDGVLIVEDRQVVLSQDWKAQRSLIQCALHEWECAQRAIALFGGDDSARYLALNQETLHWLNELMMSVNMKSPSHFMRSYSQLMELYKPLCRDCLRNEAA